MGQLEKLETALDGVFNDKAPKIPPEGRATLARVLWIIALVFGVLQLAAAWGLWNLGHMVDRAVDVVNRYGYGVSAADHLGVVYYVALLVLVVEAVILLLAAPGLKAMRKAGWNLLFYSLLLNLAHGVVMLFVSAYGGIGDLVWALIGSTIGLYLIFQVRGQFTKSAPTPAKPAAKKA